MNHTSGESDDVSVFTFLVSNLCNVALSQIPSSPPSLMSPPAPNPPLVRHNSGPLTSESHRVKYLGVSYHINTRKYEASAWNRLDEKQEYLGRFDKPEIGAVARDLFAYHLHEKIKQVVWPLHAHNMTRSARDPFCMTPNSLCAMFKHSLSFLSFHSFFFSTYVCVRSGD